MKRSTRKTHGRAVSRTRSPRIRRSVNSYLAALVLMAIAFIAILFIRINGRDKAAVADLDPIMASSTTPAPKAIAVRRTPGVSAVATTDAPLTEANIGRDVPPVGVEILTIEPRMLSLSNVAPPRSKRASKQVEVAQMLHVSSEDLTKELYQVPEVGFD